MLVNGKLSSNSALVVDDVFLKDVGDLLCDFFNSPNYEADLVNGDHVRFDSLSELTSYDNFSSRAIKAINISSGIENHVDIETEPGLFTRYKSTLKMNFKVDSNDKCEEIKRKALLIIQKHKRNALYSVVSKISSIHIYAFLVLSFVIWLYSFPVKYENGNTIILIKPVVFYTVIFTGIIVSFVINWLIEAYFPALEFCLGENKKKIEERLKIKSNIYWAIIASLIAIIIGKLLGISN